ncbi:potassium channel, sub T, member 1 [Gryganskiella cystojenkinii]|nr:potassium channel, sub T, member 1 [Gryganskiella cystojenkinii]
MDNTLHGSTQTWTQRIQSYAKQRSQSQGFIWDSLDHNMEEVQAARKSRKSGPMRMITNRKDTSYNSIRSTLRLQYAEKRKSDLRNVMSSIRLSLDYDLYKARAMALLNSKARIIFFIMMDLVVDCLFCVLYLVEAQYLVDKDTTEYPNPDWLFVPRPRPIWVVAVAMSSWNLMSALIRFVFADNKWRFIFSIQTLLDAITALPFLISGGFLPHGQYLYVPYFLRSWSVISRLQRALSIGVDIGISDQPFDPVKAKLIALVAYFIAILYNGMAAFLFCETKFAPLVPGDVPITVWDAFYFILITASTVGYGDITPKSVEAKVVVLIFIIVALSVVPGLIAGTIDTLKSSRSGGGSYIQSRGANGLTKQYLVMIGDFQSARRVADMLSGFFNKEFSDTDVRVVFLSRNKPSKDVKTLLEMPMHKNRVTMLVGNGLDEVDLKRCQARDASGVFIIPDRPVSNLESQDTMTTLLAWSLHIYAPNTRVFTYNLLPETETFQWGIVEQSMCIADVKQLLLAYNCRHRGTATLILNLLHPSEPANSYEDGWQAQYGDGTGNELYVGPVTDVFVGWTFAQVAWFVFQEFQCVLIGVDIFLKPEPASAGRERDGPHYHYSNDLHRTKSRSSSTARGLYEDEEKKCPTGQYHLTLNPGNSYRLGNFDQLIYIAQSPNDVDAIAAFTVEQYERILKDEHGHLDESRADFAIAAEMYRSLRESRADARAAARKRAEHRKLRKNRHGAGAVGAGAEIVGQESSSRIGSWLKVPKVNDQYLFNGDTSAGTGGAPYGAQQQHQHGTIETLTPEAWDQQQDSGSGDFLSSACPGSRAHSIRSKYHGGAGKKSRPAWNVALYDDDDDDDDSMCDSSSLQRFKTGESNRSQMSGTGQRSNKSSRKDKSTTTWGSSHYHDDRDSLMGGALEREEWSRMNSERRHHRLLSPAQSSTHGGSSSGVAGEAIPLSEPRFWTQTSNMQQETGSLPTSSSPGAACKFGTTALYSSTFERNAAAAAMADARLSGQFSGPGMADPTTASKDNVDPAANNVAPGVTAVVMPAPAPAQGRGQEGSSPSTLLTVVEPTPKTLVPQFHEGNTSAQTSSSVSPVAGSPNTPSLSRRGSSATGLRSSVRGSFQTLDELTYIGQASVTRSETKDLPLCHLLINPPETIKHLMKEDLSGLAGHIVVCANAGESLFRFLATLRLAQIRKDDLKTIVVLTKNPLETFTSDSGVVGDADDGGSLMIDSDGTCRSGNWDAILSFPRVFWVSGNCRHQRDLVRAGILGACSIVIMSHSTEGLDRDEFADSTAIMSHHMIYQTLKQRDLLDRQHIIVEISERSNIRFLNMRNLTTNTISKPSQNGTTTTQMTHAGNAHSHSGRNGFVMTPIFASGQVLVSSLLDNVLFQAYSKTHILDLIKLCCGVRFKQAIELDQMLGIDSSNICLIDTPEEFVGKCFLKLVQTLTLRYGIVPLGLYRAPDMELNNSSPFVFTNPLPGILLKKDDKVYVLKS